jgi:hypothetical protein
MTTEAAARLYEAQHLHEMQGKGYAVFNPHNKPISELPIIYGFNNGGNSIFLSAVAMAEDGTELGRHACSSEGYMRHDLGILEGTRKDRHENDYQKHYPDGYRMDFVSYADAPSHPGLLKAIEAAKAKNLTDPKVEKTEEII